MPGAIAGSLSFTNVTEWDDKSCDELMIKL
jgi:hypothetical protein